MASNQNFFTADPIKSVTLNQLGQNNIYTTAVGTLYADQQETIVIVFTPLGTVSPGDNFTATIKLRKIGSQAYLDIVNITNPTSPTIPSWNIMTSAAAIPAAYIPDISNILIGTSVDSANTRRSCGLQILPDGTIHLIKLDTGSFTLGTRMLTGTVYYTLIN